MTGSAVLQTQWVLSWRQLGPPEGAHTPLALELYMNVGGGVGSGMCGLCGGVGGVGVICTVGGMCVMCYYENMCCTVWLVYWKWFEGASLPPTLFVQFSRFRLVAQLDQCPRC